MFQSNLEVLFDAECRRQIRQDPELSKEYGLERFVLTHENRNVVIKNLCEQVVGYEVAFRTKITVEKRNAIIEFVAKLFIHAVKLKRDQDNWSLMRKLSVQTEKSKNDEVRSLIREIDADGNETEIEAG